MKREDFKKLKRGDIVETLLGGQAVVVDTTGHGIGGDYIRIASSLHSSFTRRVNYLHLKQKKLI